MKSKGLGHCKEIVLQKYGVLAVMSQLEMSKRLFKQYTHKTSLSAPLSCTNTSLL